MQIYTYKTNEFCYIRTSEIPEPRRSALERFMYGQTRPYIEEIGNDQDAVYLWDYDNFVNFEEGKPTFWD